MLWSETVFSMVIDPSLELPLAIYLGMLALSRDTYKGFHLLDQNIFIVGLTVCSYWRVELAEGAC